MPLNVQHSSLSISSTLSSQGSFHAGMSRKRIFSHTHAMTTHAMFAPYKSRVVSRGGLLLPLTYLPGTSVGKKITRAGLARDKRSTHGDTPRNNARPYNESRR